ncbi:MAG TPA: response regulator transcription factor [Pyrinomonadaceae bacterium]|nr:response regulator transcription factor [Pyrinomonadaceae bacterium]
MIKVLIADDHAIVRRGIREIVNSDRQMTIVGEASCGIELLNLAREVKADVIVLDISMPGRNGLETLKDLKRDYPSLPVIILSMYPEDQYAVRVFKAGAAGYMNKETAPEELVAAIKKVYRGGKYISPQLAELLAYHIEGNHPDEPHKSLSDRELQVFNSIANGKSVGQISGDLNLSVKTISTYRARILEKMNMKTNAEIIRYSVDRKLL